HHRRRDPGGVVQQPPDQQSHQTDFEQREQESLHAPRTHIGGEKLRTFRQPAPRSATWPRIPPPASSPCAAPLSSARAGYWSPSVPPANTSPSNGSFLAARSSWE